MRNYVVALILQPDLGPVIPGGGGLRKSVGPQEEGEDHRRGIGMDEEMFAELEASLKEGMEILRGESPPGRVFEFEAPDVNAIREDLNLTQQQFAAMLGISVRTLQNWAQGRREPEGPAKVLLMVAAKHPATVLDTVRSTIREKRGKYEVRRDS